ncbi:response regulator [Sinorhizobium medicae]|uniref:hypothetical protein n=1 Tax=Sinorhizobium medicae TaxID=110321 RepID=UPI00299F1397|nr:hypothetical protein [Sinorhizobium medicae]WQO62933.1 hypothetical protein U8C35_36280 [Sinorhizobium medicae]WQO89423.1 hypothetical protein U8C37_33640 [Sinorhizobium medicae]
MAHSGRSRGEPPRSRLCGGWPRPIGEAGASGDGNQEIDLALLDIQLWKETSLPLAEHLKAKGVPFAFLSGYSDQKLPPDLSDREVIPKPVDAAFLAEAVARLCKHTG